MEKEEAIKLLVQLAKVMGPQVRATKAEHEQIDKAIQAIDEKKTETEIVPQ